MTTYTFQAIQLTNYGYASFTAGTVDIVVDVTPSTLGAGFTIITDVNNQGFTGNTNTMDQIHLNMEGTINSVTVDGAPGFGLFEGDPAMLFDLSWLGGTRETTILYYADATTNTEYFIELAGDPLMTVETVVNGYTFVYGWTGTSGFVPTAFSSNQFVAFDDIPDVYIGDFVPVDIIGNSFANILEGTFYSELIDGRGGNDTIYANEGDDTILGGDGNDTIYGDAGADSISGGAGDDLINADTDDVFVDGGLGNDTLSYSDFNATGLVELDLNAGVLTSSGGTIAPTGFENAFIYLNSSSTTLDLTGTDDDNYVFFFAGDSTVDMMAGDDKVLSGSGADWLIGGLGNDTLDSWTGNDTLDGGAGNDSLVAGAGNDQVNGDADDDMIFGDAGDDTLNGGDGADTIMGGAGADVIDGGAGIDTLDFTGSTGRVLADLQEDGRNAAYAVFFTEGAGEGDTYANLENIIGGESADQFRGDGGDNMFQGEYGSDRLYGRAGNDTLIGGLGTDMIYGNAGVDEMSGGEDNGRDRFIYFRTSDSGVGAGNRDIITDFDSGEDRIEIRRFDADSTVGGKQYFTFVGNAGLSGVAGELTYLHEGGNTIVQADMNGDAIADFEIELTGIIDLVAGDFFI